MGGANVKRKLWLVLLMGISSGCSTAPVVDVLDHVFPSKTDINAQQQIGGVGGTPLQEFTPPEQDRIPVPPPDPEFSELP